MNLNVTPLWLGRRFSCGTGLLGRVPFRGGSKDNSRPGEGGAGSDRQCGNSVENAPGGGAKGRGGPGRACKRQGPAVWAARRARQVTHKRQDLQGRRGAVIS